MHKEIYLIKGMQEEEYTAFLSRIAGIAEYVAERLNPVTIKYTVTAKAPPKFSIIPFSRHKIAAVSIVRDNSIPADCLTEADGLCGAYRVHEALPVSYTKNWPDGEATPGVCLLTLFSKKQHLDHETFIDRWHNSHTPLSLKYHPLWNYNRNVVGEKLTSDSMHFNGIVEEQVKQSADLLNPFRFFGNPLVIIPRMLNVYADTKSFIDYPSMETFLATEFHIKSNDF